MARAGIILAGGYSTRFGPVDKAVACLDGVPLIRHVADRLVGVVNELIVNCRQPQIEPIKSALKGTTLNPRFAVDPVPGNGPVAGLRTALQRAQANVVYVTGCDRPAVDAKFVELLFTTATGKSGAVPVYDGWLQPLTAVYQTGLTKSACDAILATNSCSLHDVVEYLNPVVVPESRVTKMTIASTFQDVNTRPALVELSLPQNRF